MKKNFNRVKVVIDDQFERFVANERFSGVSLRFNADSKLFNVTIPKERKRSNEQPDKICEGEKTSMYFSRRRSGGYGFQMTVNVPLFKAIGEEAVIDEFKQCVHKFFDEVA